MKNETRDKLQQRRDNILLEAQMFQKELAEAKLTPRLLSKQGREDLLKMVAVVETITTDIINSHWQDWKDMGVWENG